MTFKQAFACLSASIVLTGSVFAKTGDRVVGDFTVNINKIVAHITINAQETQHNGGIGTISYNDGKSAFVATVSYVNVVDHTAWVAAKVSRATSAGYMGRWIFMRIFDDDSPTDRGDKVWAALGGTTSRSGNFNSILPKRPYVLTSGFVDID